MTRRVLPVVGVLVVVGGAVVPSAQQTARQVLYTKSAFGQVISQSTLKIPDAEDHTLVQVFRIDVGKTDSADFDIAQEHVWVQGDKRSKTATFSGYAMYVMRNGDRVHVRWAADPSPRGTRSDGEKAVESGTITILSGTGRYANIRGHGIYRSYANGPVLEDNILDVAF
jgi:hypothetical protein